MDFWIQHFPLICGSIILIEREEPGPQDQSILATFRLYPPPPPPPPPPLLLPRLSRRYRTPRHSSPLSAVAEPDSGDVTRPLPRPLARSSPFLPPHPTWTRLRPPTASRDHYRSFLIVSFLDAGVQLFPTPPPPPPLSTPAQTPTNKYIHKSSAGNHFSIFFLFTRIF